MCEWGQYKSRHNHNINLFHSMVSMTGPSLIFGSSLYCKLQHKCSMYCIIMCTDYCRCVCPIEGIGMLIWWLIDSIINESDPYEEPGAWWMFHTTSLFMVFTQVWTHHYCSIIILSPYSGLLQYASVYCSIGILSQSNALRGSTLSLPNLLEAISVRGSFPGY